MLKTITLASRRRIKWPAWLQRLALPVRRKHPLTRFRKIKCLHGINI